MWSEIRITHKECTFSANPNSLVPSLTPDDAILVDNVVGERGGDGWILLLAQVDVASNGLHVEGHMWLGRVDIVLVHIGNVLGKLEVRLTIGSEKVEHKILPIHYIKRSIFKALYPVLILKKSLFIFSSISILLIFSSSASPTDHYSNFQCFGSFSFWYGSGSSDQFRGKTDLDPAPT